jgi:hypothetical protein
MVMDMADSEFVALLHLWYKAPAFEAIYMYCLKSLIHTRMTIPGRVPFAGSAVECVEAGVSQTPKTQQ